MSGFGYSTFGSYGFGSISGPATGYGLGPFQFQVTALSAGHGTKIRFYAPPIVDAPAWDRWLRILRKQGEWPQSWDDANAYVSVVGHFPVEGWYEFTESDLIAGTIYYYGLFELRTDGAWIHDETVDRQWAYPYDTWGFPQYLFKSMPRGMQSQDADSGDLEAFLRIFGVLLDCQKTDCEFLLSLFDIDDVHVDLLPFIDAKIGWPTYFAAGGIQKRKESALAVNLYKILGTEAGYEAMLSEVAKWDCEVYEGWRYVFFSNGVFGSTTPDTTDPFLMTHYGTVLDILKYTNSSTDWHSVSGLLFLLTEVAASGPLTQPMVRRLIELIEWSKATYVNYGLVVSPLSEESVLVALDEWEVADDLMSYIDVESVSIDDGAWETTDLTLFLSNDPLSVTCSLVDRTYHSALEYL